MVCSKKMIFRFLLNHKNLKNFQGDKVTIILRKKLSVKDNRLVRKIANWVKVRKNFYPDLLIEY